MRRPLFVDVTGTLDAKGAATIPVRVPRMTGNWHNAKLTVSTSAPAHWAVLVNGRPHDYRSGDRVILGPALVLDGETVAVSVTGGPPGGTVDGTCTGVSGPPDEVMASFVPSPGSIAVDVYQARQQLGSPISVGPNATSPSTNFVLSAGTLAFGFQASSQPAAPTNVTVIGHTTGNTYYNGAPGLNFTQRVIDPAEDPSIDVTVTSGLALGAAVTFFGITSPDAVYVRNSSGEPVPVTPGAGGFTVQEGNNPPLWQSAQTGVDLTQSIASGATVTVVAGVGGQKIYIFAIDIGFDVATAGNDIIIQDSVAGSIGRVAQSTLNPPNKNWFGRPLASGAALQLKNSSGGPIVVRGETAHSQG